MYFLLLLYKKLYASSREMVNRRKDRVWLRKPDLQYNVLPVIKSKKSQAELSKISKVPLRTIKVYEEKTLDITKAQATRLYKLARALYCTMEDLIKEID